MRNSSGCSFFRTLTIIFALMLVANTTLLRIYFDIRLSDLAMLFGGDVSAGGTEGDVSFGGDVSAGGTEGDGSLEGDVSARGTEGDNSFGGDVFARGTEGDSSLEGDVSAGDAEGDGSLGRELTAVDARELLEELSLRDKITLGLILAKIDKADMQMIYEAFENGVTTEELQGIMYFADNALEPPDLEKLKDIIHRNKQLYAAVVH